MSNAKKEKLKEQKRAAMARRLRLLNDYDTATPSVSKAGEYSPHIGVDSVRHDASRVGRKILEKLERSPFGSSTMGTDSIQIQPSRDTTLDVVQTSRASQATSTSTSTTTTTLGLATINQATTKYPANVAVTPIRPKSHRVPTRKRVSRPKRNSSRNKHAKRTEKPAQASPQPTLPMTEIASSPPKAEQKKHPADAKDATKSPESPPAKDNKAGGAGAS